jgi:serine/threonine protein kinase
VALALQAMHALGWVHRDVKSPNVLLNAAGQAVLGDTGLAKQADAHGSGRGVLARWATSAPTTSARAY